jgi:hypothetical protein
LHSEIVYVVVGSSKIDFGIHKNLLAHHSERFRDELATARTITVEDMEPTLFQTINAWLYSGQLLHDILGIETMCDSPKALMALYKFGLNYKMPELRNSVLDATIAVWNLTHQVQDFVEGVYRITPRGDIYQKLLVDCFSCCSKNSQITAIKKFEARFPPDFIKDVLLLRLESRLFVKGAPGFGSAPCNARRCSTYHAHLDGALCSAEDAEQREGV